MFNSIFIQNLRLIDLNLTLLLLSVSLGCGKINTFSKLKQSRMQTPSPEMNAKPIQISSGPYHTCILRSDTRVACMGFNQWGGLGDGTTTNSNVPILVRDFIGGRFVGAGYAHTCALMIDGTIICWGRVSNRGAGEITSPRDGSLPPPTRVIGVDSAIQLSVGANHSCALLSNQTIKCWGNNGYGQIGNGTVTSSELRIPVEVLGINNAVQVAAGQRRTCAILSDQTVKCWGYEYGGPFTGSNETLSPYPTAVSGLNGVTQIGVGSAGNCALLADQSVKCWAYPVGYPERPSDPEIVIGVANAIQITAGDIFCATLFNKSAHCWGRNYNGRIGSGFTEDIWIDPPIKILEDVEVVNAGGSTCAILDHRKIKCWGGNWYGQLGNGTQESATTPTSVVGY